MTDHRRLIAAALDARDCLTRAAALYTQHWHSAAYPTGSTREGRSRTGKPESRRPSPGDVELRQALRATTRHLARCVDQLAGLVDDPPAYPLTADAAPSVVVVHTLHADRVFLSAAYQPDELDDDQRRRIHAAAASARSALRAWDTPPETPAMRAAADDGDDLAYAKAARESRREHGTAIRPPIHYPTGPRCRTCQWRLPEPDRRECWACRRQRTGQRA